jgi:hypothetical protein
VAELLEEYRGDRTLRDIAEGISRRGRARWSHQAVAYLLKGTDRSSSGASGGGRYLGLKGRTGEPALVVAVAQYLGVPKRALGDALLEDLGWRDSVRKTSMRKGRSS